MFLFDKDADLTWVMWGAKYALWALIGAGVMAFLAFGPITIPALTGLAAMTVVAVGMVAGLGLGMTWTGIRKLITGAKAAPELVVKHDAIDPAFGKFDEGDWRMPSAADDDLDEPYVGDLDELDTMRKEVAGSAERIDLLHVQAKEIKDLRAQLAAAKAGSLSVGIDPDELTASLEAKHRAALEAERGNNEALRAESAGLRDDLGSARRAHDEKDAALTAAQAELVELRSKHDEHVAEVAALKAEKASIEAELGVALDRNSQLISGAGDTHRHDVSRHAGSMWQHAARESAVHRESAGESYEHDTEMARLEKELEAVRAAAVAKEKEQNADLQELDTELGTATAQLFQAQHDGEAYKDLAVALIPQALPNFDGDVAELDPEKASQLADYVRSSGNGSQYGV